MPELFQNLSERLSGVFDKLTGRGALSEGDVNEAMREVRRALLEADVALDVVRSFGGRVAIVGDPKDHDTQALLARLRR